MRALLTLAICAGCGGKDDTVPDGTGDTDLPTTGTGTGGATGTGTGSPDDCPADCDEPVDAPRPPTERPEHADLHLSGRATRHGADTLKVVINPLVVTGTGERIFDLDRDDIVVTADGTELVVTSLYEVSELDPVGCDLVFVVDTTEETGWAIDAVEAGVVAFAEGLEGLGFDVRVGGVEFGDEVRTSIELGDAASVRGWAAGLTASGGGDAADDALDAILFAFDHFAFRPDAQRYVVVLVGEGLHECGDGCSETNLAEVVRHTRGSTLYGMVHTRAAEIPGVDPKELILAAGGLYQPMQPPDLAGFDVASGTSMDELPIETYTLTALGLPAAARQATIAITVGARTVEATLPIGSAP